MTSIIFDCDTGVDDSMAIMYGAAHGADFVTCTVTHGNVPVERGTQNTLTILDMVGLDEVPVHQGAARPMAQPLLTAEFVHGQDGLGDAGITPSPRKVAGNLAAAEIVRLARSRPGELTLVAVGPLTNIGLALLLEPELPRLIHRVVIMGGAIGVPGNASETGEANIWHDPEAAALVFGAPWDLVMAGLEITMTTAMPQHVLDRIANTPAPHGQAMWKIMDHYISEYAKFLGVRTCVLHDPLAMALALDPELATYELVRASIELRGERTRGQVVADQRGYEPAPTDPLEPGVVRIVSSLNVAEFHERFVLALGG